MITYYGKMYNVTSGEWVDNSFKQYSIAAYIGEWTQYENPFITHEGSTVTTIPETDYAFSTGTNIGTAFEFVAKEYYHQHQIWPVLRLCSSDTNSDYYIEWSHSSPSSLLVCAQGLATSWRSCYQWEDSIDTSGDTPKYNTLYSNVFVTAGSISDLQESSLVFGGAFNLQGSEVRTLIAYTQLNVLAPSGAVIDQAGTIVLDRGQYKLTKYNAGPAIGLYWDKDPTTVEYYLVAPYINNHYLPPWDAACGPYAFYGSGSIDGITFSGMGNGWGHNGSYTALGLRVNYTGKDLNQALAASGIAVTYDKNQIYQYLNPPNPPTPPVPPGPDPSDVDPDNPPDPDEPPEPIPPDNPDPYYDPTSDPDSPEYDPTKDPDSPEYDPTDPKDPYRPPSTEGGGDPEVKPPVDPVTPPPTPPSHAINSRFVTLYTPSLSQLNALAEYLWSPAWSIDGFKKIFANPMDCILGLMIFPALAAPTGSKEVNVGNLSTGVTMSYIDNQYVEVNCGSFEITEYYASYLDYDPYTKIEIYLPYIGTHRLSADDVMAKTIQLKYMIDLLSGACVAFLVVDGTTLYTFTGSCATPIPVSGNDWSNMVNGILSVAGAATAAVISGGTAGTMAAGALASTSLFVSSHKEHIRHGGSVASAAGLMSIQTPYLIVTRPRQALPIGQNSFQGYPSFMTESLGSLSGYTEVESCHLEHIPCTDEELKEIERLLKGGVLF